MLWRREETVADFDVEEKFSINCVAGEYDHYKKPSSDGPSSIEV